MKFKYSIFFIYIFFISCSEVSRDLLPEEYPLIIESNSIHLVAYNTTIYAVTGEIEDLSKIKEYPKNKFSYCKDCKVKTWIACNKLQNNEIYEISNRLNKANDIFKNIEIKNLSNKILSKDKNLFYSGYYKFRKDGEISKKIYEYFYLLDIIEGKLYEFHLSY